MARSCRRCGPVLLGVVLMLLVATTLHAAISTVRVAIGGWGCGVASCCFFLSVE